MSLSDNLSQTRAAPRPWWQESTDQALDIATAGARERPLEDCEVRQFRDQGFLVAPQVCSRAEIEHIRSTLLALFQRQAGREEGNQFDMLSLDRQAGDAVQPQIVRPSLYAPELLQTAHFLRMQAMARQLLGEDAQLSFDHSILKPAGTAAATPWHQDEAYRQDPNFSYEQISFWMPLQDVSEHNGCMRYVPGSNRGPLLAHRSLHGDSRLQAIECPVASFDESAAVTRPVPAGSCILHAGRTLHSALPNVSDGDRLVYVLAFRGAQFARGQPLRLTWLEAKHTASTERSRRWRWQGGVLVLLGRRLRQLLGADVQTLPAKARKLGHVLRMGLRGRDAD